GRDVLAGRDAPRVGRLAATAAEPARNRRHHAALLAAPAVTASRMTPTTASGCESITKCDAPSTSVTFEPARSYENPCSWGGIGWSAVPNTPQLGLACQAAAAAGSSNA